jgi:hypothetical protein
MQVWQGPFFWLSFLLLDAAVVQGRFERLDSRVFNTGPRYCLNRLRFLPAFAFPSFAKCDTRQRTEALVAVVVVNGRGDLAETNGNLK